MSSPAPGSTRQQVYDAIDESIERTRVVTLPHSDAAAAILLDACEGHVDAGTAVEFWGVETRDDDACDWRVHLRRS